MRKIKERFKDKGLKLRETVKNLRKEKGNFKLGEHTLEQAFNGMKGIKGMVYETSALDPEEGIRFRGYTIPELREKLPKAPNGVEPLPEGIFYLMLLDELPTTEDIRELSADWSERSKNVPQHTFQLLDNLPADVHPMTQFSLAILSMQNTSLFAKAYSEGMNKTELWEPMYEDVMNLISSLPRIAAYIYRKKYRDNQHIEPDHTLDWAGNFAHMLGFDKTEHFTKLMRLYLTIHVDHEGGNVSAHTNRLVGSALSDAYLCFSSAMNGLAGPLHGLANQEVIRWILKMREDIGNSMPDLDQVKKYIHQTLDEGRVIPGYGHAVLRKTDPRYSVQREFALKYMPDDELVKIVAMLYDIVPGILKETGKVKNPWPNVDAHSGALLMHFGLKESDFYTVLFGVSRALGVLSSLIIDRMLLLPIERPKSVTTKWLLEQTK